MDNNSCMICYGGGKSVSSYCGGKHYFHPECLYNSYKIAQKSSNKPVDYILPDNDRYPLTDSCIKILKESFNIQINCPYCTLPIMLNKTTRSSTKDLDVFNMISWYTFNLMSNIQKDNYKYRNPVIQNGLCENCGNLDDVKFMNVMARESSTKKWLCNFCQRKKFNYEDFERCAVHLLNKTQIQIYIEFFSECFNSRNILRKNPSIRKNIKVLYNKILKDSIKLNKNNGWFLDKNTNRMVLSNEKISKADIQKLKKIKMNII